MRILFAGNFGWSFGSSHVIREYVRCAPSLGMEIAVSPELGSLDATIVRELPCRQLSWATHLVVVYETYPFVGDAEMDRISRIIPRSRVVVIDADGHWGQTVAVDDDDNAWPCGHEAWQKSMRAISDLVLQPATDQPANGAHPFSYFGMPERISFPESSVNKSVDVQYIGMSWFRNEAALEVMTAAREGLGARARLRLCGQYWNGDFHPDHETATRADAARLSDLGVEIREPVPFGRVVKCMSRAVMTPVLVRPVLAKMRLLTPRMFESLAADTIPVYRTADSYIETLYQDGCDLCLGTDPASRIQEIARNTQKYRMTVANVRHRLQEHFAYPKVLGALRRFLQ